MKSKLLYFLILLFFSCDEKFIDSYVSVSYPPLLANRGDTFKIEPPSMIYEVNLLSIINNVKISLIKMGLVENLGDSKWIFSVYSEETQQNCRDYSYDPWPYDPYWQRPFYNPNYSSRRFCKTIKIVNATIKVRNQDNSSKNKSFIKGKPSEVLRLVEEAIYKTIKISN